MQILHNDPASLDVHKSETFSNKDHIRFCYFPNTCIFQCFSRIGTTISWSGMRLSMVELKQ